VANAGETGGLVTVEPLTPSFAKQRAEMPDRPVAIEARDVFKTFRIPRNKVTSIKERAVHPLTRQEHFELRALHGISFDIHQGEFFGIVGRNGSGKSTLLKILASIYRADAGRIRMAGRPAPFIELGVGFDPELTARENVVLNGVMMGLSRREAQNRLDSVLDFAELRDFVDLKYKNYSSGMMVRLAFSVMIHAPASDILLIDEVLAVGDAAFQQKCADVFHDMRDGPRTVVLVTHDMGAVQTYCHRAMLIHDGDILYSGDPEEVGRRYLRLNFEQSGNPETQKVIEHVPDMHAQLLDSWLENDRGERITNVEIDQPLHLRAVFEARQEMRKPLFNFLVTDADGVNVFGFNRSLEVEDEAADVLWPGQRVRIEATIENRLLPGRYSIGCWVWRHRERGDVALQTFQMFDFVIYGLRTTPGMVTMPVESEVISEDGTGDE
jgi:ABC-type polysaccharide/polyol phosphate transport system ATPase subunit